LARTEPDLFEQRLAKIGPDDVATIIYTSGTTGTPKGAILTHSNLMAVIDDIKVTLPISKEDIYLSYLPLSHVFERVCGEFYWMSHGGEIAFAESIETMAKNLVEINPTMMLVVPRVLDRIFAKVQSGIEGASGKARKLIDWSLDVGKEMVLCKSEGRKPTIFLQAKHFLAEKAVFKKMRSRIGYRLRLVVSGGAPATAQTIEFFNAIGIETLEGYGLTETSAPATVNHIGRVKAGSVGPCLPSVNLKFADDGEILLRGPSIFKQYFKAEAATNEAFADGWFKTGDIGTIDGDGYVRITDRKKDLIVNSAGKNIAPQRIEAILKTVPFVNQAVVFGDKQKSLVALLTLDEIAVMEFARENNWDCNAYAEAIKQGQLNKYLRKEIQSRSNTLAEYEAVRRFAILPEDLSVDGGELTATLKIKRNVIAHKYKPVVEALFRDEPVDAAALTAGKIR
jgi:long-chain acyl-CoA synthetase